MAGELAKSASARGLTPTIVVLTDGRANVARDGSPGRNQAEADALAEGERLGRLNFRTLIIDTSNRPDPRVAKLSEALRARYLALPRADAVRIKDAVSTALGQ